jgi:hypothetical protein
MKRKLYPDSARAKESLEVNLEKLSCCCGPVDGLEESVATSWVFETLCGWPPRELLHEIQNDVLVLAQRERKKPIVLSWETFLQVDKRFTKLPLTLCVNGLITRARAMLPTSESELGKAVREAKAGTGQVVMKAEKLDKLLQAALRLERQRFMAQPLAEWIVTIRHPMAKDFESIAGFAIRDAIREPIEWSEMKDNIPQPIAWREINIPDLVGRIERRESTRRCRLA